MAAMTDSIACFRPGGVCGSGRAAVAAKAPAAQTRANRRRVKSGGVIGASIRDDYRLSRAEGRKEERPSFARMDKAEPYPTWHPLHGPAGFAIIRQRLLWLVC